MPKIRILLWVYNSLDLLIEGPQVEGVGRSLLCIGVQDEGFNALVVSRTSSCCWLRSSVLHLTYGSYVDALANNTYSLTATSSV